MRIILRLFYCFSSGRYKEIDFLLKCRCSYRRGESQERCFNLRIVLILRIDFNVSSKSFHTGLEYWLNLALGHGSTQFQRQSALWYPGKPLEHSGHTTPCSQHLGFPQASVLPLREWWKQSVFR